MGLLMICREHCLYVDLREQRQLGRFFPLGFNGILIFFLETYSLVAPALRSVSRHHSASVGGAVTGWVVFSGWAVTAAVQMDPTEMRMVNVQEGKVFQNTHVFNS